ncbi:MAG TPA: indole-3-glycerol phosphate synthase TrpC [Syntrophorhabdaceae bacterium]|mgnify:CR=1 FL=1|nr:indole-3-glycerol phosphate synthase TrpC [Syntrophorhabdaceae bacterium]
MTFLERVVEEKKEIVRLKKRQRPMESIKDLTSNFKKRPFYEEFKKRFPEDVKIIGEIKMASPSQGILAKDTKPETRALVYYSAGVKAISIITEERYFNGSLDFIPKVRNTVSLSLLRKDFIVDVYEIYESKAFGADCVLLICEVLEKQLLKDCLHVAKELNIDCLCEIHELSSFEKIADLSGYILGINNRDLRTLKVDISKGFKMLDYIPIDVPVIIESGIEKRKDVLMFMEKGVSGFLIGTALMRAEDPFKKIIELRGGDGTES